MPSIWQPAHFGSNSNQINFVRVAAALQQTQSAAIRQPASVTVAIVVWWSWTSQNEMSRLSDGRQLWRARVSNSNSEQQQRRRQATLVLQHFFNTAHWCMCVYADRWCLLYGAQLGCLDFAFGLCFGSFSSSWSRTTRQRRWHWLWLWLALALLLMIMMLLLVSVALGGVGGRASNEKKIRKTTTITKT